MMLRKFKDIYSKLDLDLYLMFVDCDRLGQESDEYLGSRTATNA